MSDSDSSFAPLHSSSSSSAVDIPDVPDKRSNAAGAEEVEVWTTDAKRFTQAWLLFYLSKSKVQLALLIGLFYLSLIIAASSLGAGNLVVAVNFCPEFGEIVPEIVERCPSQTVEVLYTYNAKADKGVNILAPSETAHAPLSVFLPHATVGAYYTIVILDPDSPSRKDARNRNHVLGIVTNLRLSETTDINTGEWLFQYEAPVPSTGTSFHRYVYLVYRHSFKFTGSVPGSRQRFLPDEWTKTSWPVPPELVGANWFREVVN